MKRILFGALAVAMATGPAFAGALERGKFAGSISVGAEFPIDGDVHGGQDTGPLPLSAVAPLLTPVPALPAEATDAELRIEARSYDDIYGEAANVALEFAYGLGANREVFGSLGVTTADEGSVQVGNAALLDAGGSDLAVVPVFGRFGEYSATTLEAGVRQYFPISERVQPYVAGRVGAAFVDEINASFTIPALNLTETLNNVPFYGETTVLTGGVDVGVSFDLTDRVAIQAETGLRYTGELDGDDAAIGGLGLASINDTGERWSAPVTVRARIAF